MADMLSMKFTIGEKVVHPHHGVGIVSKLEEKQFDSSGSRMYYVISIHETTLWVPVNQSTSGLRKLSAKDELDKCRQILRSAPVLLSADRSLLSNLSNRIKEGTILAHCEVVRDLTAFGWRKSLFGPVAEFLQKTITVLSQEWAIVDEVSQAEASYEISNLLKKGKAAHEH